eukprot:GFKZ01005467.1.p1 GENE.GFKZ01005467.1~~GFKZ01005467.1.p1  ORF type:complete len:625 (-),score=80.36 GFKZ01005467.1:1686-3560(-)
MDQTHCAGCSAPFTFTKAKHPCRSCGDSFCHSCSSGRRPVPEKGHHSPVRVCDLCLHAVDRRSKLLGLKSPSAHGSFTSNPSSMSCFTDPATLKQREAHVEAMDRLKRIYKAKIRPLEQAYKFSEFYASELTDGDFDARPFVLLVGGYSVGKTSFIRYMLERDFPGSRIGPEPTTDRFLAVMAGRPGQAEGVMPGNAAAVDVDRPFSSLGRFGVSFLSRFEVSELASPILDSISFIDTPGILSGEKQRVERGYSFEHVVEWFAERADRILLLFDGNKLDISDELKRVIESLKGHDDKIRIVLNKADMVDPQQLMRVYGALMWSLGKVIRSPEVLRVFIGSFWDKPLNATGAGNAELFKSEERDLLDDLRSLPRHSAVRKINELVKRARLARVHALLVTHLKASMPILWGHKKKQERLALRLTDEYSKVQKAHGLAIGDFPAVDKFKGGLEAFDLSEFPNISKRLVDVAEGALSRDIPRLMLAIGMNAEEHGRAAHAARDEDRDGGNPFGDLNDKKGEGEGTGQDVKWVVTTAAKAKWDGVFQGLGPSGTPGRLSGAAVRGLMLESGLPPSALKRIWDLADLDVDGMLDEWEFAVAMTLIKRARADGIGVIPEKLPEEYVPPCKR